MQQLEALRRDDYTAAYTFAAEAIREMFDLSAFERMVRSGYPEIARSSSAHVAESRVGPDGHVYLRLKIRGANGTPSRRCTTWSGKAALLASTAW